MEKFYLQIEDYLLGELSEEEKTQFEIELKTNETLVQAVEAQRQVQERLHAKRLRAHVQQALEPVKGAPNGRIKVFTYLMIGVFLLGIGFWFWPSPAQEKQKNTPVMPQKQELIAEKAKDTIMVPVQPPTPPPSNHKALALAYYKLPLNDQLRGEPSSTASNTTLQQAYAAFNQKNYPKAAALLNPESLVANDEAGRYLRAHSRFNAQQYEKAASDFLKLQQSFQYKYDAQWNLLLCYLAQDNQQDSAIKKLLQQMTQNRDFPYYTEARKIQSRLSF